MRIVIDRIEEDIAIVEKEDGSFAHMAKELIPPSAKEGDVLLIQVDERNTIDREEEIQALLDEVWEDE